MSDEPLVEDIAEDIRSTIATITIANGYKQDLLPLRPTSNDWRTGTPQINGRVIIVQEDPDEDEATSTGGNSGLLGWIQPFALVCYVLASDKEETPIDTRTNRVRADLEKALTNGEASRTRGGRAIDTFVGPPQAFDANAGSTGIIVLIIVRYRTKDNDPYTPG